MILAIHASAYAYNNNCNTIIRVFTVPHNYIAIMAVDARLSLWDDTTPPARVAQHATHAIYPLYHTGAGYDRNDYPLRKISRRGRGGTLADKNLDRNYNSDNTQSYLIVPI